MRLLFIHPIYLPPLSDVFLRKDFNYASYLAHAYGKTLASFFNTSWLSLFLIMILVDSSRVLFISTRDHLYLMPIVNLVPPLLFLVVFISFRVYFSRIKEALHPQIQCRNNGNGWSFIKPEEINFHVNYEVVDPFSIFDNLPIPEYLEVRNIENEQMAEFERYE